MRSRLSFIEAGKLGGLAAAKTVALQKQQRIDDWDNDPKLCLQCNKPLSYDKRKNDFCNQSCGAIYHNLRRGGTRAEVLENCLSCNKPITKNGQHKYCSRECMSDFWWQELKNELLSLGIDNSSDNRTAKKYLIELHHGQCQICALSEWQGETIPLVLDHIDGNSYNNMLSNLRVICNNCDAIQPTYKGRNKGNGRFSRAARYKLEKEMFVELDRKHYRH